jgi:hypothetical protein
MHSVKVRLAFSQGVVQLGLESDEVVEVIARAKRGSITKGDVPEYAVLICNDVMVAEERPDTAKALRYLRIEGGHVVYR